MDQNLKIDYLLARPNYMTRQCPKKNSIFRDELSIKPGEEFDSKFDIRPEAHRKSLPSAEKEIMSYLDEAGYETHDNQNENIYKKYHGFKFDK